MKMKTFRRRFTTHTLNREAGGGTLLFLLLMTVQSIWAWDGSGTETDPYLIQSNANWKQLAANIVAGNDYSGMFFRMTSDINTDGVGVGTEETPFAGTFDGDNHTLTYNKGTAADLSSERCAPFRFVSGATIRYLNTTGEVHTKEQYAGGIISMVNGSSPSSIVSCHSDMKLFGHTLGGGVVFENAAHGGLVGAVNKGGLVIERSSYTGTFTGKNSAGMVGWSNVDITIRNSMVDLSEPVSVEGGRTFARMAGGTKATLTDCYFTVAVEHYDGPATAVQGECVFDDIIVPEGCTYEFESEPTVNLGGKNYWKSGARIRLNAPDNVAFDHWDTGANGCYINDPWQRNGIHQIHDVKFKPTFTIATQMPEAKTMHTFFGVKYRYLSRNDYHLYLSDETCRAKSWSIDKDGYLVMYDKNGSKLFITAAVGYEGNINHNIDGAWIWETAFSGTVLQNDNVAVGYDRTHLGVIAPRAFKGCKDLKALAFQSDNTAFYEAIHEPNFMIGEEAFADCPNLTQFIMMYYNRTDKDKWDVMPPTWVINIADNAFSGSDNCRIMVDPSVYQQYLNDERFADHWNRVSLYMKTENDMKVDGAIYSYMRNSKGEAVKNDAAGHEALMQTLRFWNADYVQFNAASLLAEQDKKNIWYTQITGVDNSSLSSDGTMRIYNDPGSYYNYKTIAIGENAFEGNENLKAIEFWQTNGRSENSYNDLKMVIQNGAFKNCKNLKELRMFYYVQDGDDHWETLGPENVIPGDNIFGEPPFDENAGIQSTEEAETIAAVHPTDFKILVASDRMNEFLSNPNWLPYAAYLEPVEWDAENNDDFTRDGLTYAYMTNPGGIRQTSQTVSQDVSWWTVPRIGIEVIETLLTLRSIYSSYKAYSAFKAAWDELVDLAKNNNALKDMAKYSNLLRKHMFAKNYEGIREVLQTFEGKTFDELGFSVLTKSPDYGVFKSLIDCGLLNKEQELVLLGTIANMNEKQLYRVAATVAQYGDVAAITLSERAFALRISISKLIRDFTGHALGTELLATGPAGMAAITGLYSSGQLNEYCNSEYLQKGMRQNILSNIHQVGVVGGGYVYTTPQKNLIYHTYIKKVADDVKDAVIMAGTDKGQGKNASARTIAMMKKAFQNKKNLETVSIFENNVSTNEAIPMLLTIPDSAFVGCDNLRELNLLLKSKDNGTYALGPESFILGGDSIFAGLDPKKFHIRIDESRKQDFLDSESWKPLEKYFIYDSARPASHYNEYGAQYAYAYENGSVQKVHKVNGHKIEHTVVVGATVKENEYLLSKHQGALKLCNDIGEWNNFQLDAVKAGAFKGNKDLRVVNFTDLYGQGAYGTCYTGLDVTLEDSCFAQCPNLANMDMLYLVTDGDNHISPITPQQVKIGKGVFDGSTNAVIKMLPEQVALFEADSAWAAYKDRFRPCIIHEGDEGVLSALKPMAYYDMAATGYDPSYWTDHIDLMRIAGAGFSWLDGRFTKEKDNLRTFGNFKYFESVGLDYVGKEWFDGCNHLSNITLPSTIKTIREHAFRNCTALAEIEIPASVEMIDVEAFLGCSNLKTVVVCGDVPATIHQQAIPKNPGLKIYVPKDKVNAYKEKWSYYSAYIVGIDELKVSKHVVTTKVGELADKLGLTAESASIYMAKQLRYLDGNYAKYDSLTVSGPLNNLDLAVLRYMAGCDAYTNNGKPTDGQLRYLNLYDASLQKDQDNFYCEVGGSNYRTNYDNWIPPYAFYKCSKLETVILPRSTVHISDHAFDDATALKRVAVCSNATISSSNIVGSNYHVLNAPLTELVFYTYDVAMSAVSEPWGQPIEQVFTLRSQLGEYLGDAGLMNSAQSVTAPFGDDAAMHALAQKQHFFPSEYFGLESVEDIFNQQLDQPLTHLDDFWQFYKVKKLERTFKGCDQLQSITLPDHLLEIGQDAFAGCSKLDTIRVACDSVPMLAADAFKDLPHDFVILVPTDRCKRYRAAWTQYADHINADNSYYSGASIITVELTEPNTLAAKLGLTVFTDSKNSVWAHDYHYVTCLCGDYSNIHRLKVKGPISGQDLSVLRYLSGFCPWTNSRSSFAPLEYIDLYDAQLKASDFAVASDMFWKTTRVVKVEDDNVLPAYSFLQCYNLKTLILPRTCKEVKSRALQQCEALETLVVGDDMEEFNWDALDDDASLTRMYILSKKKMDISSEFAVWRWLCNNYNPTFDAFYVRPSLYQNYLNDNAYTGSSWQRTNNISTGVFNEDDTFAAFASHAAGTIDELNTVTNVNGWFDQHPGVKDLTLLKYTAIDSLDKATFAPLTQLEKVTLPVTLTGMEDGLFGNAKQLRYVDFLLCDSTNVISALREGGIKRLGINTDHTLIYVPDTYGESDGTNIVAGTKDGKLHAKAFHLLDSLNYMVPYAFDTDSIKNSRALVMASIPYTVCLPYKLKVPSYARAYKLSERSGSTLVFVEVTGELEAMKPYLLKVVGNKRFKKNATTLNTDIAQSIPASGGDTYSHQDDVMGYSLRGTFEAIDNKTAAELGAYILQGDGNWHPISTDNDKACVLPFRAYLLPSAHNAKANIRMTFEDATGIDTIETIDIDGTHRYYDLNGHELPGKPAKGIYIYNSQKYVNK